MMNLEPETRNPKPEIRNPNRDPDFRKMEKTSGDGALGNVRKPGARRGISHVAQMCRHSPETRDPTPSGAVHGPGASTADAVLGIWTKPATPQSHGSDTQHPEPGPLIPDSELKTQGPGPRLWTERASINIRGWRSGKRANTRG